MTRTRTLQAIWAFLVLVGLFVVPAISGCKKETSEELKPSYGDIPLIDLPNARQSPSMDLQDELARIADERAAPSMLAETRMPPKANAAARLLDIFDRSRYDMQDLHKQCDETMPRGEFILDAAWTNDAAFLNNTFRSQRQEFRDVLDEKTIGFEVPYDQEFVVGELLYYSLWAYARLEAFEAAERFRDGDMDGAVDCIGYILRLASLMSRERELTMRLSAAAMRMEALKIAQTVVRHRNCTPETIRKLYRLAESQLEEWPPDRDAWIGHRAWGLWIYEYAREGRLAEVLAEEELSELKSRGLLEAFEKPEPARLDNDELFYLNWMRGMITSCDEPYHVRRDELRSLYADLDDERKSQPPEMFPVLAEILIAESKGGHVIQARDRANIEGWLIACAWALGLEGEVAGLVNPLTGQPYRPERLDSPYGAAKGAVRVMGIGAGEEEHDDPPWLTPDFTK